MFNQILFDIRPHDQPGVKAVLPIIDAIPLTDLIRVFEHEHGYNDPAGGYAGIIPDYMNYGPLDDYFLARGTSLCRADDGAQYFLGCECGEVGCWPLMGHIEMLPDAFRWSRFHNPFREQRNYEAFGPFLFERQAYEDAIKALIISM